MGGVYNFFRKFLVGGISFQHPLFSRGWQSEVRFECMKSVSGGVSNVIMKFLVRNGIGFHYVDSSLVYVMVECYP